MNEEKPMNEDSVASIVLGVSEGNPGAIEVLLHITKLHNVIDPDADMGSVWTFLRLLDIGLVGPKLWMLYKNVCGQSIPKMLAVLRGHQLGFVTKNQLLNAVENYGSGLDVEDVCLKVCAELPRFNLNPHIP